MKTFTQNNLSRITSMSETDRVPLTGLMEWIFLPGGPRRNWVKELPQDGIRFHLDACQDLDKLCPPEFSIVPNKSEGVLYSTMTASRDGIALIGIGADWWFEAYCNGELIGDTFSTGNEFSLIMPDNHRLFCPVHEGENQIAVHIRRGQASWAFSCAHWISFQLPPAPKLTAGPWLSYPDSSGKIAVNFCTMGDIGAGVQLQDGTVKWHQRQGQILKRTFHSIPLDNLPTNTTLKYQVVAISPASYEKTPISSEYSFHIPDATCPKFSLFLTADLQFDLDTQQKYLSKMLAAADAQSCDLFVLNGDVNSAFQPTEVINGPLKLLQEYGTACKPVLYLRGNHELRGPFADQFLDYFPCPNGTTNDLLRYGDTAFLILDAWEDKPAETPGHPYCKWNLDTSFLEEQKRWLATAVQQEAWLSAKRRIVLCHAAAYSHFDPFATMCPHLKELTDEYFTGSSSSTPILCWFAGHIHAYHRSIPRSNIVASPEPPRKPFLDASECPYPVFTVSGPNSFSKVQASCFRVDFRDNATLVQSWDQNGSPLEKILLTPDGNITELLSLQHYESR